MSGIGDQCHRVGYKSESTLDDHENQVERHRDGHAGIDALGRYSMSVTIPVGVTMPFLMVIPGVVMVIPGMVVLFHGPNLTSVARPYGSCSNVCMRHRDGNSTRAHNT